ncbi:MAG: hypothetical protein MZV70_63305 [Desulfobacterales bacterium]|nr:hypothetical protein [Desulfobacterales bacterium]
MSTSLKTLVSKLNTTCRQAAQERGRQPVHVAGQLRGRSRTPAASHARTIHRPAGHCQTL